MSRLACGSRLATIIERSKRGEQRSDETCNHLPQAVGIEPATFDRALVEQRATLTIGPPAVRRLTDFEY